MNRAFLSKHSYFRTLCPVVVGPFFFFFLLETEAVAWGYATPK